MGIQSHLFVPVDLAECVALAMCREDFASLARRTLRSLRFIARIGLVSQLAPEFDWYDVGGAEPAEAATPRRRCEQVPIFLGEYELPEEGLVFGRAVSLHDRPPFC